MKSISDYTKEEIYKIVKEFKSNSLSTRVLISYAVGTSTIRSFKGSKIYGPLSIYQSWAYEYFKNDIKRDLQLKKIGSFHNRACLSLKNKFARSSAKVEDYQVVKLVDLTFKFLPLWNQLDKKTKKGLFENVYCPIDKYSLQELRKESIIYKKKISANPSMKDIKRLNYVDVQVEIQRIASEKGFSRIVFDLLSWDQHHNFKLKEK